MSYSFGEGIKRGLKRGTIVGLITFGITAITAIAGVLPTDYAFIAPILTFATASLEKFLRNYQENKDV